jgi:tetratricopeptide (TPR) repeat protein
MKSECYLRQSYKWLSLVIVGLMLSACTQTPAERSAKFLATGKKLLLKKDGPRAALQFRNAIRATPDNPEAYYELGEALSLTKDIAGALGGYRKTLELDPKYSKARLRVAQVMSVTSDPAMVKQALSDLQELMKNAENNPEVLNTLAYAQLRLGEIDSAVQNLDRVLAQSPGELGASALLAGARLLDHDPKGAEEVLLKACKEAPQSAEAHRILGDFYVEQKRMSDAEGQFRIALGLDPKSGQTLLDLAKLQVGLKRLEEADQSFRKLAKFDEYHSIHSVFLYQIGRKDEATRELEKVVKDYPDDRAARSNLVIAYRAMGRPAEADKVLVRALKANPKDSDALLQRGEIALGTKDFTAAEADLNQVLQFRPAEPEVHYLLAKLNEARGATLTYRQELGEAIRLNPNLLGVRLELARSLTSDPSGQDHRSGPRAALNLLDTAPVAQQASLAMLIQRNWAFWELKDYAALRKGIDEGLARQRTPDLLIQFGLWKISTGDPAGARPLIEEALKLDPTDLRAVQALTQTYLAEKNSAMALQKVREYASQRPKSAAAQDFLGVLLMASGDRKQARTAFEAAKAADSSFVVADIAPVQVDASESKFEDARKRLEAVLAGNSNNMTARLWLGNIEETLGHHAAAIEHFRKVVQSEPDNPQASNNLAYLLSEYANNADEALKYAEKAVNVAPEKAIYSDTLGWTLYRKGLYGTAIPYLERAAADKRGDVVWKYHLAMAYGKSGDLNRGRVILASALKIDPNVPEAKTAKEILGTNP